MSKKSSPIPFPPYIPPSARLPEFTLRALLLGIVLGVIFGASSLYLVLKVGLTVSASIPVAVIAVTLFRLTHKLGGRDSSILENNIAQTAGSSGESIAFGLGATMPAILILGFDLEIWRVMLVSVLGALLGILLMIPMRRTMVVIQHGELKYPEGTACAEMLKAAANQTSRAAAGESVAGVKDQTGRRAAVIFGGFGLGLLYKTLNVAFKGWKDVAGVVLGSPLKGGYLGAEISPELLGVGYIIGPRQASVLAAGGVLSFLLLIPMIKFFGEGLGMPLAPGTKLIGEMGPNEIRGAYILYIGAGAVAVGGLISLVRALPMIWRSLTAGIAGMGGHRETASELRTDQDIPLKWVVIGSLAIVAVITVSPPLHMNLMGAVLILLFGFLFATVSSRLAGEIGMSVNPISGMTVATLLFTCLIFLMLGWTGGHYYVTALSVGAIIAIASSNAGSTSQDLKTGFLVGATPRLQQYAILTGALISALALGPVLLKLNDAATVYVPAAQIAPGLAAKADQLTDTVTLKGPQALQDAHAYRVWQKTDDAGGPPGKYLVGDDGQAVYFVDPGINGTHTQRPDGSEVRKYDAPKAMLMSYIIKGILDRKLPWTLVLFGAVIAAVLEMAGVPSLAFAVGVYLPLSSSAPIFIGGMVRWLADRRNQAIAALPEDERQAAGDRSSGVLLASGYIAGGALAGIVIAFTAGMLSGFDARLGQWAETHNLFFAGPYADLLSLLPYAVLIFLLYRIGAGRASSGDA